MSEDKRIAVVAALLEDERWQRRQLDADAMARIIVKALDQRADVTQREVERENLLEEAEECWIPRDDLLEALNALPGAPLTMGDLKAKMKNIGQYHPTSFNDGDPDLQADCLRVYRREKKAGTAFRAILGAILDEVLSPAWQRKFDKERAARAAKRERLMQSHLQSGKDFGLTYGLDKSGSAYMQHTGQLYRITRLAAKSFALFRVRNIGDKRGKPTEPHIFHSAVAARDMIHSLPPGKGKRP
jgi:hypothetical protein